MSGATWSPPLLAARCWAALERACGWPGLVGLALLAGAGVDVVRSTRFVDEPAPLAAASALPRHPAARAPEPAFTVPESGLADIQRMLSARAAENGLAWPAADYRIVPATQTLPPVYEVRCTLKGSYPAIRRFVTQAIASEPPASIRGFALSRADSELAEVEGQVTLAFFMPPDESPMPTSPAVRAPEAGP